MGRHSSDTMAKLTVKVPRGHQGFWDIIRELRTFTVKDVDGRSNTHCQSVRDYIVRLEKAGYVRRLGNVEGELITYELVTDQPEAPRLRRDGSPARDMGRGQDQMWRAIKMLGEFTARDVSIHGSTDQVRVRLNSAQSYLKHLQRAGYLMIVRPGKPGHKPGTGEMAIYRLIPSMNTGPMAPQVQRTEWVWDPNRQKVMGPEGGER